MLVGIIYKLCFIMKMGEIFYGSIVALSATL
ncbi:MAG: hypothetical protein ACI88H_003851, partial [Cocleimonas sp.]